jgi:hypothetical protein
MNKINKSSKFLTSISIILFLLVLFIIQRQSNQLATSGAAISTEILELI